MSDETRQSEQQSETTTATETGDKWGDPITPDRVKCHSAGSSRRYLLPTHE